MTNNLDDAARELLTPEELEALNEDLEFDDTGEGDDTGEAAGEGNETQAEAEQPEDDGAAADSEDADAGEADAEPVTETADTQQTAPQPEKTRAPAELQAALDDLNKHDNDLFEDYNNGELSEQEYKDQRAALREQSEELLVEKAQAVAKEKASAEQWQNDVLAYGKQYPEIFASPDLVKAFDAEVRAVTGNAAFSHMSGAEQLKMAHARVAMSPAAYGLKSFPELKGTKPKEDPKSAAETKKAPQGDDPLGKVPQTLAKTPASDTTAANDDPFAALDRLAESGNPEAYEDAIMKLSDDAREAYMSRA